MNLQKLYIIVAVVVRLNSFGQKIDSIIAIKPFNSIVRDTIFQNNKYNRIDFDTNGKILAFGNVKGNQTKNGKWVYFDIKRNRLIWQGTFRNGMKDGWWYDVAEECKVKYKLNKQIKRVCHY